MAGRGGGRCAPPREPGLRLCRGLARPPRRRRVPAGALGGAQARASPVRMLAPAVGEGRGLRGQAGSTGRRCLRSVRAPDLDLGRGLSGEGASSGRGLAGGGACPPLGGAEKQIPGPAGVKVVRSGGGPGRVSHWCPSFPPARPREGRPPCTPLARLLVSKRGGRGASRPRNSG